MLSNSIPDHLLPIKPVLDRFLKVWDGRDDVSCILLTGSWATGHAGNNSDVDIRVVLKSTSNKIEKQAFCWDGIRVNAWAYPSVEISKRFQNQWRMFSRFDARSIYISHSLFSGGQVAETLKKEAKEWLERPFPAVSKDELELLHYSVVSNFEELLKKGTSSLFFNWDYIHHLKLVWELYYKRFGIEDVISNKMEGFLTDKVFRKRYMLPDLPHEDFTELFSKCLLSITDWDMFNSIRQLQIFVLSFFPKLRTEEYNFDTRIIKINHN